MRLGGFVIHGDAAETLPRCLESLGAVADEVVAVDSGSRDGSAELVRRFGARRVELPWQGYGAARAAAAAALSHCDYLFFLDSDEFLSAQSIRALRDWRVLPPARRYYTLRIRDWAELGARRFVFRVERHVRLVRRDGAIWNPKMVVHERLPRREAEPVAATIEHRFATSLDGRVAKNDRYALLWALRAHAEGRRAAKPAAPQRAWHTFRDLILKGALFRGGFSAAQLAWQVSRYHSRKYELLREVTAGRYPEAMEAIRQEQWERLFSLL